MLPSIVQNSIWKHFIQPCVNKKCFILCSPLLSTQDALSLKDSGSGLPQCSIGGRYCSVTVSVEHGVLVSLWYSQSYTVIFPVAANNLSSVQWSFLEFANFSDLEEANLYKSKMSKGGGRLGSGNISSGSPISSRFSIVSDLHFKSVFEKQLHKISFVFAFYDESLSPVKFSATLLFPHSKFQCGTDKVSPLVISGLEHELT